MDSTFELQGHFKIELNIYQQREDQEATLYNVLIYHSSKQERLNIFVVNADNGDVQQVASLRSPQLIHIQQIMIKHPKAIADNLILMVDQNQNILTYPKVPLESLGLGKSQEIYFYRLEKDELKGFTIIQNELVNIWNIKLSPQEEVLKIRSSYHKGEESPRVAIWDDKKVLFKLIDHTNFALISKDTENQILNLYIVNAKTGKIIFQSFQKNVEFSLPINLVFDENSVIVTYFNPLTSLYEIWTIEAYHTRIEISFLKLLEDYYFNQKSETKLNYYESDLQAVFLQQIYGYPLGVKHLSIARTLKSLTKKNLLIITPENQVHSLDRNMISSRRRRSKNNQVLDFSHESAELPAYEYLLPINHLNILNYNQNLYALDNFYLTPTELESTSLLLVTGDDIFFTRLSPDKTYDMIQNDFNYVQLGLTVTAIIIVTQLMRKMTKKTKIRKIFYNG